VSGPTEALFAHLLPEGVVVEITSGMSRGQRGVIVGPTRYRFGEQPVYDVRLETGYVRPIREDFLRRLSA
jgi:hypothetical protein